MRINRPTLAKGVFVAFAAIGLFFLVTEHRAHAFGALIYILLGLCVVLLYLVAWHSESEVSDRASKPGKKHNDPE